MILKKTVRPASGLRGQLAVGQMEGVRFHTLSRGDTGRNQIQARLPHGLGVTTLWIAPIFRQRVEIDTYHGYGIQNFLDIDPRFGTRDDLVELVSMAHQLHDMKVVLDVI